MVRPLKGRAEVIDYIDAVGDFFHVFIFCEAAFDEFEVDALKFFYARIFGPYKPAYLMPLFNELRRQVAADTPCDAGDEYFHGEPHGFVLMVFVM